jgi:hypothetical protein
MDATSTKTTQQTKTWGMGLPTRTGRYVFCNADYGNARILNAVETEPGTIAVFERGQPIAVDANLRHFGPIPGIQRSLDASARKAS